MEKETKIKINPNFLEISTIEEANTINLEEYRFERYSPQRDVYIFVKRVKR